MKKAVVVCVVMFILSVLVWILFIGEIAKYSWFPVVAAIVITFIVTGTWQTMATKKNRMHLFSLLQGMYKELNGMSKELGYEDLIDYYVKTKSKEYASNVINNINNSLEMLEKGGI